MPCARILGSWLVIPVRIALIECGEVAQPYIFGDGLHDAVDPKDR
jgi:hypothetical protein